MVSKVWCSFLVTFWIISQYQVLGLDEDSVKEMHCIASPDSTVVGINVEWLQELNKVYIPMWSKFHAHRTASDLFGRSTRFISELEMGPSSCLMMKDGIVSGFGKSVDYNTTWHDTYISWPAPWAGGKSGKFEYHLTDNESFILGVTCWEDNQAAWAVLSTEPFLAVDTRTKILNYIKSIGFKAFYAVDENFGYCGSNASVYSPMYPSHYDPKSSFANQELRATSIHSRYGVQG